MMIDIDHVSFQYSGAEQENLQDFNLQIKKGECVVLTGESGCGKTCVTRLINTLIPHFYEGEMSGAVLIDGVDTRTIQPHDLSDKIGSVFQNPRSQSPSFQKRMTEIFHLAYSCSNQSAIS